MTRQSNRPENRYKSGTGRTQLFDFPRDSYLERTSRPIFAIVFLLPFIAFYGAGAFSIGTQVLNSRVATLGWLHNLLGLLGLGGRFAWAVPPLAVLVILLSLQVYCGRPWCFRFGDMPIMTAECISLAVPVLILTLCLRTPAGLQGNVQLDSDAIRPRIGLFSNESLAVGNGLAPIPTETSGDEGSYPLMVKIAAAIGGAISGELVFRLILVNILMVLFQNTLRLAFKHSMGLSVFVSALLFSGQNATEPFNLATFAFRANAGAYFSVLFLVRGPGQSVGTHVIYNILAVLLGGYVL